MLVLHGLFLVEYRVLPVSQLDARMSEIRSAYGSEGDVLYFVDNKGAVMGLLKKKTAW